MCYVEKKQYQNQVSIIKFIKHMGTCILPVSKSVGICEQTVNTWKILGLIS